MGRYMPFFQKSYSGVLVYYNHTPVCYIMNALHLVAQPADGHAMLYYGQDLI